MGLDAVFELEQDTPSDIGFQVDYDRWRNRDEESSQWFIHWPGFDIRDTAQNGNVNGERAQLRAIESNALKDDYAGFPYDWAIGQSGRLYRGRGRSKSAATSGDVDGDGHSNNYEGEAICFLVNTREPVSDAALETAAAVIRASGYTEVYPHSEAKGTKTSCPGDQLRAWVRARPWEDDEPDTQPEPAEKPATKPAAKPSKNWTEKIMADLGVHRKGDRNKRVSRIQALLNVSGMHSLKVDGIFGPKTERAVEEYQTHFRLDVDGVVGPETWGHLLLTEKY